MADRRKLEGYQFWEETLKKARYVVAPMVDQSELPWRLLSRRHGCQLAYTPMFHAALFSREETYFRDAMQTCPEDRPLIVQFCANDPDILVQAALLAQDHCDAIDLNLGCPQSIARRGHYGAFLQDDWDLIRRLVSAVHERCSVPVTCKIRVFQDVKRTVAYAQMLEKAGCQLLTVHGRTKEQKGSLTGLASWEHIKAVKDSVKIPVFANGNILNLQSVESCMKETGTDGIMTAEGNLHNPALFEGKNPPVWEMADEYLQLVRENPCQLSAVRGHLFKLWHHSLQIHTDMRTALAQGKTFESLVEVSEEMKKRCQEEASKPGADQPTNGLPFPHWICQPYIRPRGDQKDREQANKERPPKRHLIQEGENAGLSRNQIKRRMRYPHKNFLSKGLGPWIACEKCGNPKGLNCVFSLCRACCKVQAHAEKMDCPSHRLWFKTKEERRRLWEEKKHQKQQENTTNQHEDNASPDPDNPNNSVKNEDGSLTTQVEEKCEVNGKETQACQHGGSPVLSEKAPVVPPHRQQDPKGAEADDVLPNVKNGDIQDSPPTKVCLLDTD
ncbi:tRNA-dihydrouridine(16/17) synthase [NAD(P)(+)]-like isoform X2 [Branchiostoma floridae x Branchiostoma japonicum]